MGLSIADFTQTLLPVATGAAQLASNAGLRGGFSAFLQAFIGSAAPGASGPEDSAVGLSAALTAADDSSGQDSMAQALAAICAGLGLAAPVAGAPVAVAHSAQAQSGAGGKVTGAASLAQLEALTEGLAASSPLDPEPAANNTGTSAPSGLDLIPDVPANGPGEDSSAAFAAGFDDAPASPAPSVSSPAHGRGEAPDTQGSGSLGTPTPTVATPDHHAVPATPPAGAEPLFEQPPPPDTVSILPVDGVVRSVGNAAPEDVDEHSALPGGAQPTGRASSDGSDEAPRPVADVATVTNHQPDVEAAEVTQTPARPLTDLPEAVRQVGRVVVERLQDGGGTTRIHLDPAELGRVSIDVRSEGGHVHLNVVAERPEAAQLLRDHAADLARIFQQHGLDLHVQVGTGGQERGHGHAHQQGQPQRQRAGEPSFASVLGGDGAPSRAHSRVRAAYNPDGRHVYRV